MKNKNDIIEKIISELGIHNKRLTIEAKAFLQDRYNDINQENQDKLIKEIIEKTKGSFVNDQDIIKIIDYKEDINQDFIKDVHYELINKKIKIIDDPGVKKGRREDTPTKLLLDRYEKISKILQKQFSITNLSGVGQALKLGQNKNNNTCLIIGLVNSKRISKKGIWLDLEDKENRINVFVSVRLKNTYQLARIIPLDCVVAVKIKKLNQNLIIVENIYLPELFDHKPNRSKEEVYTVLTSDLHIGSKKFLLEPFKRFISWLSMDSEDDEDSEIQEIASKVKYIIIAGDVVDGIGHYPKQDQEIIERELKNQYKLAYDILQQIPKHITIIISPGERDGTRRLLPQPPISKEYAEDFYNDSRFIMVGNPVNLNLHDVNFYVFHGSFLEDGGSIMPGIKKENYSKVMEMLLRFRHIVPTYGLKTPFMLQEKDDLVMTTPPDILHAGHVHITSKSKYKNTLIINSGGWQDQTLFQLEQGIKPTPGLIPVINLNNFQTIFINFLK